MKNQIDNYIRLCLQNDRQAQHKIYQLYAPILYGICLRYMKDEDDAKDVFQESFIIAFQKIHQYKFEGSFEGWLKRIFINKLLETLNKKKKDRIFLSLLTNEEEDEVEHDVDDGNAEENDIPQDKLLSYIQELPQQYRLVFNLYVFEKLKHKEIADRLNISESTSKSNFSRAKKILQQKILVSKNIQTA